MKATIDGIHALRAIASIMVVAVHAKFSVPEAKAWPEFGAAGVDIFFVISGFVMAHATRNIRADIFGERAEAAGLFMRKRIVRIVPLYWLALLWAGRRSSLETDLVADFLFIPRHNNEWPDMIAPIVQQGWTLNYEMFFYTIFAVAILCGPLRLFATLSFLIALAVTGLLFGPDGLAGIFYTDSIVLEFGFGIILQRYLTRFPAWKRSTYLALIALGFVMLALGYHQEPRAFFQGLPALLIVWASFKGFDRCMRLPSVKLLGDASYAIYLFHWASFGAFNPVARLIGPDQVTMLMLGYIATGIVSGVLIHLLIEKPLTPIASRVMGLKRHIDKPPRAAPATP